MTSFHIKTISNEVMTATTLKTSGINFIFTRIKMKLQKAGYFKIIKGGYLKKNLKKFRR